MDRELYRRRQRRRAIIGWSTLGLLVAGIALVAILGGSGGRSTTSTPVGAAGLFASEMTSSQYEALNKGEEETQVLTRLHGVGLQEDELEGSGLASLFPPQPEHSTCSFWTLSDAPGHYVRLCFSDPQGVLLEKSVAAPDAEGVPKTLA